MFSPIKWGCFANLCLTLCDPMECSIPGFPVFHYLSKFAQTHVCWVSDAIQQSHPLLPSSPPVPNLSQHQNLFQWIGSSQQVGKVLELQRQHQSFQMNTQGWFPLGLTDLIFWESKDSQGSSPGSSVHGILQARILECVAIPFSKGYSQARDQTRVYCIAGWFFTVWATREAL